MRQPTTPIPFSTAPLRAALLGFALCGTAAGPWTGAWAQPAAALQAVRDYQLPAGPLGRTLSAVAAEAGLALSFEPALTEGLSSPAVQGRYTAQQALERLLAGSGLALAARGDGSQTLRPAAVPRPQAQTMGEVKVTAQALLADGTTEGTGSYTAAGPSSTATGLGLTLRETPQSVSVVTRQQMDDFHLATLQDIAKATPGLYAKNQGVSDQESMFYARGFALQHINVDGLPLDVTGFNERNVSADMVMYDRVEVVRGATGLLEGAGTPSGTINLLRKRPTAEPLLNLTASLGSWNNRQLSVDASRAINEAGTLRGRAAASWRDSDSFVDVTSTENRTLYGVLEADLSRATTLGIGGSVQRTRTDGVFRGLPTYSDGGHMGLGRSTYLDTPDSFQKRDNDTVFAHLEHRFANDWTLKASATHIEADSDSRYTLNSRIAGSETTLAQSETGWAYGTRQDVLDVRARGPVEWLGRRHELLFGASYRKDDSTAASTWDGGDRLVEIATWNPHAYALSGSAAASPLRWGRSTREKGLYAAGNFELARPLHLVLGARLGWYAQNTTGWYTGQPTWTRSLDESAELVPYAGLVYDLDRRHAVYGSVTEIFQPQSSMDASGNVLDPLTGTNYELGAKGEYFGGALNAHAAIFRIRQRNRAVRDESHCPSSGSVACYRAAGEVESNGVELQLSGALAPGWQLSAGYTYARARYTQDAVASNVGQRVNTDEPLHLFKIFTNYRLPGQYHAWSLNGSVYAQSGIDRSETGYHTAQGSYAIFGAGVAYRVSDRLRLQLSVDNLFDKRYYSELGYSWAGYGERYGAPRSFLLTARYSL